MKHSGFTGLAEFPFSRKKVQLDSAPSGTAALPNGVTVAHVGNKTIMFASTCVTGSDFVNTNLPPDMANGKKKRPPSRLEKIRKMAETYMDICEHIGHSPEKNSGNAVEEAALEIGQKLKEFHKRKTLAPKIVKMLKDNTFLFGQKEPQPIPANPHEHQFLASAVEGKKPEAPLVAKAALWLPIPEMPFHAPESAPIEKQLPAKKPLAGACLDMPATRTLVHDRKFARLAVLINLHGESVISGSPVNMEAYKELLGMQRWAKRTFSKAKSDPSIAYVPEIKYYYQKYLCYL